MTISSNRLKFWMTSEIGKMDCSAMHNDTYTYYLFLLKSMNHPHQIRFNSVMFNEYVCQWFIDHSKYTVQHMTIR